MRSKSRIPFQGGLIGSIHQWLVPTLFCLVALLGSVDSEAQFEDVVWEQSTFQLDAVPEDAPHVMRFSDGFQILLDRQRAFDPAAFLQDTVSRLELGRGSLFLILVNRATGSTTAVILNPVNELASNAGDNSGPRSPPGSSRPRRFAPAYVERFADEYHEVTRLSASSLRSGEAGLTVQLVLSNRNQGTIVYYKCKLSHQQFQYISGNREAVFSVPALERALLSENALPSVRVDLANHNIEFPARSGGAPLIFGAGTARRDNANTPLSAPQTSYEIGLPRISALMRMRAPQQSGSLQWSPALRSRLGEFIFSDPRSVSSRPSPLLRANVQFLSLEASDIVVQGEPQVFSSIFRLVTEVIEGRRGTSSVPPAVFYYRLPAGTVHVPGDSSAVQALLTSILESGQNNPVLLLDLSLKGMDWSRADYSMAGLISDVGGRIPGLKVILVGPGSRPPFQGSGSSDFSGVFGNTASIVVDNELSEGVKLRLLDQRLRANGIIRPEGFVEQMFAAVRRQQANTQGVFEDPLSNLGRTSILLERVMRVADLGAPEAAATRFIEEGRTVGRVSIEVSRRALQIPRLLGPHGTGTFSPLDGVQDHLEVLLERTLPFLNYPNRMRNFNVTFLMGPPGTGKNRIASDVAQILNGGAAPVPYEVISFASLGSVPLFDQIRQRVAALRGRGLAVPTLILDEVHLAPQALLSLLPVLGNTDAAAAAGLDLEGIDLKILMNVDQNSPAYRRIRMLSPHSDEYVSLTRQVFLESLGPDVNRAGVEALASRVAQDFLVLRSPTLEVQNQLRDFSRRVLHRFETNHNIRLMAQEEVHARLAEIAVRDTAMGWRGADTGAISEIEQAFSRFLTEHPQHELRGSYQLVLENLRTADGTRVRFRLREVNDLAPVLESNDNFGRLRRAIEASLLARIESLRMELQNESSGSRRTALEETLRQLNGMLRGFEASGQADLFVPESLRGSAPPTVHHTLAEIRFPNALNPEQRRLVSQRLRQSIEEQFRQMSQAVNSNRTNADRYAIDRALETIRLTLNEMARLAEPNDTDYHAWRDSVRSRVVPSTETSPARHLTEDLGLIAGAVIDELLRSVSGDFYRERAAEVARIAARRGSVGGTAPEDSTVHIDPIHAAGQECARNLWQQLERLRRRH